MSVYIYSCYCCPESPGRARGRVASLGSLAPPFYITLHYITLHYVTSRHVTLHDIISYSTLYLPPQAGRAACLCYYYYHY